ncbi:hypothetical protein IQ22_01835 [Pseudomonas duriflava]|uniref:Uncharacterized protein n=1 Tax=Pseudomonas duriflava TaxID=459528 RepID=A0A562QFH8_9PSED|nr:hypothetical protein [Pseudomonas duriflava]TWI54930.1 hypothetical protein IQ22_01835 [Pseudomonas duriflava]
MKTVPLSATAFTLVQRAFFSRRFQRALSLLLQSVQTAGSLRYLPLGPQDLNNRHLRMPSSHRSKPVGSFHR